MNKIIMIIASNLRNENDVLRICKSLDIDNHIIVYFINQSEQINLEDIYAFTKCHVHEIRTRKIIPLAVARNLALKEIYSSEWERNEVVMFVDDDAWFPIETLKYLLEFDRKALSLHTFDPITRKSFSLANKTDGEIKGWHLVRDIVSISIVIPLDFMLNNKLYFNEKLGLGNEISQGEESLFVYNANKKGLRFYRDTHQIFHPYKKSFNLKNFYSMAYFWSWGCFHVSYIFAIPMMKYLIKYTIAFGLTVKDSRYIQVGKNVWKGTIDGCKNTKEINN